MNLGGNKGSPSCHINKKVSTLWTVILKRMMMMMMMMMMFVVDYMHDVLQGVARHMTLCSLWLELVRC